jgi:hypothetical protein
MSRAELLACLRADQFRRWQRGEPISVETYLKQQDALNSDSEAVAGLVHGEILLRESQGEEPRWEEYVERLPRHADALRRWQMLLQGMPPVSASEAPALLPNSGADPGPAPPYPLHERGNEGAAPDQKTVDPALTQAEAAAGSSSDAPGDVAGLYLPGYEILEELGRGGMGVVYKARQLGLNRLVAVKMILAGQHAGPDQLARFQAEAEAVAQLQHPAIVQVYEIGTHDGRPFISLELVTGGSLAERVKEKPFLAAEAAKVVEVSARAVQYAHGHGFIHRDLKPANILLTAEGQAKIADFGLAKQLQGNAVQTKSGEILGTPSYMAPEQAVARPKGIGPPVDIYAMGAILYNLLTGRPPFQADTPLDTLLLVLEQEPTPVRQLNPRVPRDLETICHKCLQKLPGQRYSSAAELADDLLRFQEGEPIQGRPPGVVQKANRWIKRHQLLSLAYSVSAVALLALLVFPGWQHQRTFSLERATTAGFHYVFLPTLLLVLAGVAGTRVRIAVCGAVPLLLAAGVWWWLAFGRQLDALSKPEIIQVVTGSLLLGTVLGLAPRDRRGALLWLLPSLLILATLDGFLNRNCNVFLAGALHGLLLGGLTRIVAWGLNREQAPAALGAFWGAVGGSILALLYAGRFAELLREADLGGWRPTAITLYAEIAVAYLGALATALLLGIRPRVAPPS